MATHANSDRNRDDVESSRTLLKELLERTPDINQALADWQKEEFKNNGRSGKCDDASPEEIDRTS